MNLTGIIYSLLSGDLEVFKISKTGVVGQVYGVHPLGDGWLVDLG